MHPRNRHQARYDFAALIRVSRELGKFVRGSPSGDATIDFADPAAVIALNRALLQLYYGISNWEIPPGYLCPPVPGRADYIHRAADLLATSNADTIPRGESVAVLDIGTGANCIYPIIGAREYGWRFVATEIDPIALASARRIVSANPSLAGRVDCRQQRSPEAIFEGIIAPGERFALVLCNPPFHASAAEAAAGTKRKVRNLAGAGQKAPVLNFGGRSHELWCRGGEVGFVRRMAAESARFPNSVLWFSTLVSRSDHLPSINQALQLAKAADVRTIHLARGQKISRVVAWTFLTPAEQLKWWSTR